MEFLKAAPAAAYMIIKGAARRLCGESLSGD
jgi:hypothetical protein